jgi:diguanylate cyclase (GGDEF)-like protein
VTKNHTLNRIAFWLTVLLAAAAFCLSVYQFPVEAVGLSLALLTVATLFFSVYAMIQIPRAKIHVTISDVLIFAALLVYGVEVATILAIVDSVVGSLNLRRKGVSITARTIVLNSAIAGISIFVAGRATVAVFGDLNTLAEGNDVPTLALVVAMLGAIQFIVNSVFVTIFTWFKSENSIWTIWHGHCLNGLLLAFTSALLAGAGANAAFHVDTVLLTIAGVLMGLMYFTYNRYVIDVRETAEQAEFSERQRAEQAENHIEELQHHIAQQEVTEKALRESKEKFKHAAYHDSLTNLPNRNMFTRHLQFLIKRCQEKNSAEFAVLFLDLDRFKTINDSLGHSTGDSLILGVARRLSKLMREKDLVARLSGDEFAIILQGISNIEEVQHFAELIRKKLTVPFTLDERQVFTSVSIGIAVSDEEYDTAEHLLRDADIAMYQAKASGRPYVVFDSRMHARAVSLLEVETDLRYALERNEMEAYYQPIINLKSMRLIGFEALMRWNHPTRGLVSPGEFIPVSEDTGLIIPLTLWMLNESCQQLATWQERYPASREMMMSVNLSGKHFSQDDLVATVKSVLKETGITPRHLKLELTESAVMDNAESVISILHQLKGVGVRLSIDDFGTGYSSLSYLHRFPIDALKIDRSFVSRMESGTENGEIVRTVVALAKALGLTVIAEGIESIHQLHQLRILGSEYGQGFLFSRPVPIAEAEEMIQNPERWKNIMPERSTAVIQHKGNNTILQLGEM